MSTVTEEEKSALLAQLVGWKLAANKSATVAWRDAEGEIVYRAEVHPGIHEPLNLYESKNLSLARRVLAWSINNLHSINHHAWKYYSVSDICMDFVLIGASKPLDYILSVATDMEPVAFSERPLVLPQKR